MKIFFGSHAGKDIQQLDSSYLVWLIESCTMTDHILREECKKELSYRLNLTFDPPPPSEEQLKKEVKLLIHRIDLLEKLLIMSFISKNRWNHIIAQGYMQNTGLLNSDLELIKKINK